MYTGMKTMPKRKAIDDVRESFARIDEIRRFNLYEKQRTIISLAHNGSSPKANECCGQISHYATITIVSRFNKVEG
ncbi:hypothetical protein [Celerinatantimonas yamalensis]|uniref:Uncharacterized protein n=1 Tax=Celerinatantimonas yamalensis TaxID=559956 RepID=A0ABW9G5V1_9GAMM